MSSSLVWVQLHYKNEGKESPVGNPIFIKTESLDPPIIGALAEAVRNKLEKELDHAGLTEIFFYPPGTKPSFSAQPLPTWDPIPSNSSGPQPLVVVAPAPPQRDALPQKRKADDAQGAKRGQWLPRRYVKGVEPGGPLTLARDDLVHRVLDLASKNELVLIKGPAAVGKSSLINLTIDHCLKNKAANVPPVAYTYMEAETSSKPALEQLKEAVEKMPVIPADSDRYRILFCDDIQHVCSTFWQNLVNTDFFVKNKLRIVAATTRRCASDPSSPMLQLDALISFSDLCLSPQEEENFLEMFLPTKPNMKELGSACKEMVINAVSDQCSGHIFAIMVSLDKLDDFAQLESNRNANAMISHLLSKKFLMHTYSRIWPENMDKMTDAMKRELEDAIMWDADLSTELQSLLLKVYFIQDTNQSTEPKKWSMIKQEISFKLSARWLYSSLFTTRAPAETEVESIQHLVEISISKFSRVNLVQSAKASGCKKPFPKEGSLQQMFYLGLVASLPASTEVVSEMSAILPDRGDGRRGELDFYVNSHYYYGIELMWSGANFQEHKNRFEESVAGVPASSRGKYFTPNIKAFCIVDFEPHDFIAKVKHESRLLVVFFEDYGGCTLMSWSSMGEETRKVIQFSS